MGLFGDNNPSNRGLIERLRALEVYLRTALNKIEASNSSGGGGSTAETTSIRSLTGTAAGANNLGSFTGNLISDGASIKSALQQIETAIEALQNKSAYYKGSAATFAALPTAGVANGDLSVLTADDGTNLKGLYQRNGGVWVSILPTSAIAFATTAEALAGAVTDKAINPARLKEALDNRITVNKGIERTNTTENVAPTGAEIPSPKAGSIGIVRLSNGVIEVWNYTSAWAKAFKHTPTVVDGNLVNLTRNNATENVAPASGEVASPVNGDTAIVYLNNGKVEFWSHNGTAWSKAFVVDTTSVPDASETVKGKIEIATTAEAAAGTSDNHAITPLKLRQQIASDAEVTAETANKLIDGSKVSKDSGNTNKRDTKVITEKASKDYTDSKLKDRVFAPSNNVTVATAGQPTAAEIKTWNDALGANKHLNAVIYYTGTTTATDNSTHVFHSDKSGNITLLERPASGAITEIAIVSGNATINPQANFVETQVRYTGAAATTFTVNPDTNTPVGAETGRLTVINQASNITGVITIAQGASGITYTGPTTVTRGQSLLIVYNAAGNIATGYLLTNTDTLIFNRQEVSGSPSISTSFVNYLQYTIPKTGRYRIDFTIGANFFHSSDAELGFTAFVTLNASGAFTDKIGPGAGAHQAIDHFQSPQNDRWNPYMTGGTVADLTAGQIIYLRANCGFNTTNRTVVGERTSLVVTQLATTATTTAVGEDLEDVIFKGEITNNQSIPLGMSWGVLKNTYERLIIVGSLSTSGVSEIRPYTEVMDLDNDYLNPYTGAVTGAEWWFKASDEKSTAARIQVPTTDSATSITVNTANSDSPASNRMIMKIIAVKRAKTVINPSAVTVAENTGSKTLVVGNTVIQGGTQAMSSTGVATITLPVTMKDGTYVVQLSTDGDFNSSSDIESPVYIRNRTTTSFQIQPDSNVTGNYVTHWMVFGEKA
jgi:hypothetical protein